MLPGQGDVKYSKGWAFGVWRWGMGDGGWAMGNNLLFFLEDKIDTKASSQFVELKPKSWDKGLGFKLHRRIPDD